MTSLSARLAKLREAATKLPWIAQSPSDGQWYIDTHAYPEGPEPVVSQGYSLVEADAALIVALVNALPQIESLVAAAELPTAFECGVRVKVRGRWVPTTSVPKPEYNALRRALAALSDAIPEVPHE